MERKALDYNCFLFSPSHSLSDLIDFLVASHWGWPFQSSDKLNWTEGDWTSGGAAPVPNWNKNYIPARIKMQRRWTECFHTSEEDHSGARQLLLHRQYDLHENRIGRPATRRLQTRERRHVCLRTGRVCADALVREGGQKRPLTEGQEERKREQESLDGAATLLDELMPFCTYPQQAPEG